MNFHKNFHKVLQNTVEKLPEIADFFLSPYFREIKFLVFLTGCV